MRHVQRHAECGHVVAFAAEEGFGQRKEFGFLMARVGGVLGDQALQIGDV
jgi:hypothetical protein